jgi:hypothetical protein
MLKNLTISWQGFSAGKPYMNVSTMVANLTNFSYLYDLLPMHLPSNGGTPATGGNSGHYVFFNVKVASSPVL